MPPSNSSGSNTTNTNPSDALNTTNTNATTTTTLMATTDFDDDWEEWDSSKSPFWIHCLAGSMAGVAEHVLVYPLDTVRTHIQVCAACGNVGQNLGASGQVLQQAAAQATTVSSRKTTTSSSSSSLRSSGGGLHHTNLNLKHHHNNTNLSMLQAFRQLTLAPRMAALEPTTAAAVNASTSTTNTTNGTQQLLHHANTSTRDTLRLWRGVQSVLVGCIPAHALYFGTYELVKAAFWDKWYGSSLAGAAAVFCHDLVLGPLDTVKQRLQLGHYKGLRDALQKMVRHEGVGSLYRSFPVTLATNIPYGMIMVGTNECLKDKFSQGELTLGVTLGASSVAGLVAAATTTPLDRIKTYLQTQQLAPSCMRMDAKACPNRKPTNVVVAANWQQAAVLIYRHEGLGGFVRGIMPRILSHTPAVAISWTTYETCKKYLLLRNNNNHNN
jgi:solute carrier family 25 iron transporter 28/37